MVEYADLCLLGPTLILHETEDTLCCPHVPRTQVPEKVRISPGTFKGEGREEVEPGDVSSAYANQLSAKHYFLLPFLLQAQRCLISSLPANG